MITIPKKFTNFQLSKLRAIEIQFGPVVRHFSTTKMLLVNCGEAFINEVSATILNGRTLEEFDKLSINGKWIFIQELLKFKKKLTIDKDPLQGFSLLVRERNKLMHFKGMKIDFKPLQIYNFLIDLKISPNDCFRNIKALKNLIKEFCSKWTGTTGPLWLNADEGKNLNPCFYVGDRGNYMVLSSNKYDKYDF